MYLIWIHGVIQQHNDINSLNQNNDNGIKLNANKDEIKLDWCVAFLVFVFGGKKAIFDLHIWR